MPRAYVSSTTKDLDSHRRAACEAVLGSGFDLSAMEHYAADRKTPLDFCRDDLSRCDTYVGILAFRYGFVPSGETCSITELEYRHAMASDIPCLMFLAMETPRWPLGLMDRDRRNIDRLRAEIARNHVVRHFHCESDLRIAVAESLSRFLQESPARRLLSGLDQARALMRSGTYAEAARMLDILASNHADSADVRHLQALARFGGRAPRYAVLKVVREAEGLVEMARNLEPRAGRHDLLLAVIRQSYYATHGLRMPRPGPEALLRLAREKGVAPEDERRIAAFLGLGR